MKVILYLIIISIKSFCSELPNLNESQKSKPPENLLLNVTLGYARETWGIAPIFDGPRASFPTAPYHFEIDDLSTTQVSVTGHYEHISFGGTIADSLFTGNQTGRDYNSTQLLFGVDRFFDNKDLVLKVISGTTSATLFNSIGTTSSTHFKVQFSEYDLFTQDSVKTAGWIYGVKYRQYSMIQPFALVPKDGSAITFFQNEIQSNSIIPYYGYSSLLMADKLANDDDRFVYEGSLGFSFTSPALDGLSGGNGAYLQYRVGYQWHSIKSWIGESSHTIRFTVNGDLFIDKLEGTSGSISRGIKNGGDVYFGRREDRVGPLIELCFRY